MKSTSANTNFSGSPCIPGAVASVCFFTLALFAGQQSVTNPVQAATAVSSAGTTRVFDTPQQAAEALVDAAENFDQVA
jgi:hypothetical protein